MEGEAALDGGSFRFHGVLAGEGDWAATRSAVRELVCCKRRPFRPLVPKLGDDGKPLVSLHAKANQHQRELVKECGRIQ